MIELLVVIAIIAILAAMLLPALAKAKQQAQCTTCLNNNKELAIAWHLYATENHDALVLNNDQGGPYTFEGRDVNWASGWMSWNDAIVGSDNTNWHKLIDGPTNLLGANIAKNYRIFACPSTSFVSPLEAAAGWSSRCRSCSMDGAIGDGNKWGPPYTLFVAKKMSDLMFPGPSSSWLLIDEHPDWIDDPIMYTEWSCPNGTGSLNEFPGCQHVGACGVAFADGSANIHKWLTPQVGNVPVIFIQYQNNNDIDLTLNKDMAWIAQHTPRPGFNPQ